MPHHDPARSADPTAALCRARFEQSLVPQLLLSMDGRITECNAALAELLDVPLADLTGRPASDLKHPSDPDPEHETLRAMLTGGRTSLQVERVLRHSTGRPVPVLVSGTTLHDEDGAPLAIAAFLHDLSLMHDLERRRRQQEDFFLAISQHASDLAVVVDPWGQLVYTSPALTHRLGYDPVEVAGTRADDFVHPDDRTLSREVFTRVVASGETETVTLRIRDASGAWRWSEETMRNLLDTPIGGVVCNLRDVTERIEAERALRASEARYRAIADHADEGLWVVSPVGDTLYVNNRLCEILGLPAERLYAVKAHEVFRGEAADVIRRNVATRRERGAERYELVYGHPDGSDRILRFSSAPLPADGADEGGLALVTDITDARRLEDELRRAALHDTLTGLPNRALLLDRLEQALARDTVGTAVLFIDLDQFKLVNDARGHGVGDELLVAVARRLRASMPATDTVARFGGDEFLVVCQDVDATAALQRAEDIHSALERPFQCGGAVLHVSASVGVALSPVTAAEDLLRNADTAMYAAKRAGRRAVRLFDANLAEDAAARYELGRDLRQALEDDLLEVHFQPVVDLRTGAVLGVEALSRWLHPSLGQVPPDRFVSVAEEVGMARELDHWVLCDALARAGELRSCGALAADAYVAVNLSARSLTDPALESVVLSCSEGAGFDPGHVLLEITESALMEDTATAAAFLARMRGHGFRVAIDDFGTGHSALAYLREFPVSTLKIDRSFVAELAEEGSNSRAIVASVLELARAIGVDVVAEGVETAEQATRLAQLGCVAAQGWLWSRAVPPAQAVRTSGLVRDYAPATLA